MTSPLISIILPVYDGATTLSDAIRSVLEQTFKNYEILLLDDGSTDGSLNVAKTFSDFRLQIIYDGTNHGLAYRLNQGIDLARGRYIARMDQDDICFPERLAKQFAFLETHPDIDLLGCRAMVFQSTQKVVGLMPFLGGTHEEICASPWNSVRLAHPTWMGRTEWFRHYRYRIPEVVLAEDQELLLRAYPESHFACLQEVLLAYRREHFFLIKTLRQRYALLGVQLSHFARRRQWFTVVLSIAVTFLKALIDCVASLPACETLFFLRMTEAVPTSVVEKFRNLELEVDLNSQSKT